jgi:predicted hotdog family 3-hydroxylacyl-ACP dehydratase
MVLIDEVPAWSPDHIRATRVVREGQPFVEQGELEDAALIECLAQTIAAGDAQHAASKGGRVRWGYLTGLTSYEVLGRARVGETVHLEADCQRRMEGLGLFLARAFVVREGAEVTLARGTLKLFVAIDFEAEGKPFTGPPKWSE